MPNLSLTKKEVKITKYKFNKFSVWRSYFFFLMINLCSKKWCKCGLDACHFGNI